MPDSKAKMQLLAIRMYQKTKTGAVSWEKTAGETSFDANFPNYSVRIEETESFNYVLSVFDEEGRFLDGISDERFPAKVSFRGEQWTKDEIMGGLYSMARRQALGTDEAIDAILKLLK